MPKALILLFSSLLAAAVPGDARAGSPVLAVFDFEARGAEMRPELLTRMAEHAAVLFAERGVYRVVPRASVRKLLRQEKADSYRECYDESCQIEIGKELAANLSLTGSVLRIGRQCAVHVRIFDLRTAATLDAANVKGACGEEALFRSLEAAAGMVVLRQAPSARSDSSAAHSQEANETGLDDRCKSGDADACGQLGSIRWEAFDFESAATMYERACELKAYEGCRALGFILQTGL